VGTSSAKTIAIAISALIVSTIRPSVSDDYTIVRTLVVTFHHKVQPEISRQVTGRTSLGLYSAVLAASQSQRVFEEPTDSCADRCRRRHVSLV